MGGPPLGQSGRVERGAVVAGAADGCAGVDDPAVEVGDDLHVHPAHPMLAGEQVGALGSFAGRGDQTVEQDRPEPGSGGDPLGDRRGGLGQQRSDPAAGAGNGRLRAAE